MTTTQGEKRLIWGCVAMAGSLMAAHAEVKLPDFFSNGMVLQQEIGAPVWGWAAPGQKVKVSFAGQTLETKTERNGQWKVTFKGLKANATGSDLKISVGGDSKTLSDVLVGEVWLASGQSNMEWKMSKTNGVEEGKAANDPLLRVYVAENKSTADLQTNLKGIWTPATGGKTSDFTAVGYYFAKELRRELKVPVGVIECAWGGKPVQAFISVEGLEKTEIGKALKEKKKKAADRYSPEKADEIFVKKKKKYTAALEKWKADGKKGRAPRKPQKVADPNVTPRQPANIFQGMIAPLQGYGSRGAIWYQGESNSKDETAKEYKTLLSSLVDDWRHRWGHDLSFYFVQIANFNHSRGKQGVESGWVTVQDQQRQLVDPSKKLGMAVTNDIGDAKDIHPKNKEDVGKRLARWALNIDYGKKDVLVSGPHFKNAAFDGAEATISFDYAVGLKARDGKALGGFELAGKDGKWVDAKAQINGEKVVVSAAGVKEATAVRYAWRELPTTSNLVNKEGLPTSCFSAKK